MFKPILISNMAPIMCMLCLILTVGSSTINTRILAKLVLGNLEEYTGESLLQPGDLQSDKYMRLADAGAGGNKTAGVCGPSSLDKIDVIGKVVLCERGGGIALIAKGRTVKDAGGTAMILMNDEPNAYDTVADPHVLPATHVSYDAGEKIRAYINNSTSSTPWAAILFGGMVIGLPSDPNIASFI